ncbi:MAG: RcnB family protein [Burkholderiales bacterium]|nr:RcnB family protein [Burkholderiales bacterium]
MKLKTVAVAMLALSICASGTAFAQGNQDRNERGDSGHAKQAQRGHRGQPQQRMNDDRREGRGAGPEHNYYRGGRMPPQYRTSEYVVSDWRGHHLSAPPRGYHWVQSGGDYVLVAIATGIILQLLLSQ